MQRRLALLALGAALLAPLVADADDASPATPAAMTPAEAKFVATIRPLLESRYPTPAAAEKAGYVRYTNEDETGAISYANKNDWNSTSEAAPAQLWYDVKGRLLGADYSALADDRPTAPSLFGVSPSRLTTFGAHIHYVLKNGDGTFTYSKAVGAKKYAAAGLDPMHPTAAGLVKVGAAPSVDAVQTVFLFPHIWDLSVWVLPNPAGAFADKNPNVVPVHPMGEM